MINATLALLFGLFAWSFTEYAMHNWNGHLGKGRFVFSREHLAHHAKFDHRSTWAARLHTAIPLLSSVLTLGWLVAGLWLGFVFTAGLSLGYLGYSWLHHDLHVSAPKTAYGRWVRRHHFYHHFSDSSANHGVTSPLWDWVFRTYRSPGLIEVPKNRMMPWLGDKDTATISSEHAAHYTIKRRSRSAA